MPDDNFRKPAHPVIRLFGVILIILGALNTMLSWRGGIEVNSLPVYLIAVGFGLCLIAAMGTPGDQKTKSAASKLSLEE